MTDQAQLAGVVMPLDLDVEVLWRKEVREFLRYPAGFLKLLRQD
jgi:hypothetical protein